MPYSVADIRSREFILRMLLVAPPKSGKTSAAVLTSPRPVFVFNTDGKGGLDYCALSGEIDDEDLIVEDAIDRQGLMRGLQYLRAHKSSIKTVVFDNISAFASKLESEIREEIGRNDPRVLYPELSRIMLLLLNDLLALPQHLVVIGHTDPAESNKMAASFGHILSVSGRAKITIPAMIQDWVWLNLDVDNQGVVKREFLLSPEGNWTRGVRSIRDVKRMPADITRFIELASKRAARQKSPDAKAPPPAVTRPGINRPK